MGKMHAEGVTLIDLLVTVAVVAMVFAIGVPAMSEFITNNRMSAATNDLVSSLHMARAEAVRRPGPVVVCPADDWQSANPQCDNFGQLEDGWLVVDQSNGLNTVLYVHEPLRNDIEISGPNTLSYQGNSPPQDGGGNRADFEMTLCDYRGDHHIGGGRAAGRKLILRRPSGRPRLYDEVSEVNCGG